jgi:hypothetical protein
MTRRRERTASWRHWWAQAAEARPDRPPTARLPNCRSPLPFRAQTSATGRGSARWSDPMRQRSNQARSGVSLARTKSCSRHEEANHEQGYGQEEGSEEEAGKVSAGKARGEAREETEPRVSGLRCSRLRSAAPIGGIMEGALRPSACEDSLLALCAALVPRICVFERGRDKGLPPGHCLIISN